MDFIVEGQLFGKNSVSLNLVLLFMFGLSACSLPLPERPDSEIIHTIEDMPSGEVVMLDPELQLDSCLYGTWVMYQQFLEELAQAMVPVPGLYVPDGDLEITFDQGGVWRYEGFFTIRMGLGADQYLEALSQFITGGLYGTNNEDVIVFDLTAAESEALLWTGYKNGEAFTVPGEGPSFSLVPPGTAPYRCSELSLEIDTTNPAGDTVTMLFVKE